MKRLNYLSTLLKLKSNNIHPNNKNNRNNTEGGINIDSHIHKQIKLNTINTLANLISSKDSNNDNIHLGIDLNNNSNNDNNKTYIQYIKYNIKSKKIEGIDNIEV